MTWYLSVMTEQRPYDIGLDQATGRPQVAFNIRAEKRPSNTFEEEMIKLLVDGGVGVFGVNIFASSDAQLPAEHDSPAYLKLTVTGGPADVDTHNQVSAYHRPTMRITATAETYVAARALANAAYSVLGVVRNADVVL